MEPDSGFLARTQPGGPQMSPRRLCGVRFGPPGSNPAWRAPDESQDALWSQIRASWLEPGLESPR